MGGLALSCMVSIYLDCRFPTFQFSVKSDLLRLIRNAITTVIKMGKKLANMAEFNSELESAGSKLVVIDFFAEWCGPCKMIAPKIEELSAQKDNVVFVKVDVDENEDAASQYNISAMPTFVFIKNKEKVDEMMGANYEKLKEMVEKHA